MLVVNRFRGDDALRADLETAHGALAARPGYVEGTLGRNVDDPGLWVLVTRWQDIGSYRRALSAYDVKMSAVPVLSRAIDEPSGYELVGDGELNTAVPRDTDAR
ncbi:MAG: antibiotic biosynthesis monooxygenase family protein [Marmoricola sp.]